MRISIIIPNFNHAAYVGQAIDSALLLEWPDIEVIVIDDGSTDASWAVISRYGSRITTIRQHNARASWWHATRASQPRAARS